MTCDLCGLPILPGENYRAVRDEYTRHGYREHIRCPGASAVAIGEPPPKPTLTVFNHASMA